LRRRTLHVVQAIGGSRCRRGSEALGVRDWLQRCTMRGVRFRELDVVCVCRLLAPSRTIDGTLDVRRQPRVGDIGAIVHALSEDEFIVECVDADGLTVWLADFASSELEIVKGHGHPAT
jgi:hypothetical protein